jgi:hypothetical protein
MGIAMRCRVVRAKRVPVLLCLVGGLVGVGRTSSAQQAAVPLAERARGAERVVVGRVASVAPTWQVNEFGDRLIVSRVQVSVSETLKGQAASTLDVEVEGGTIGDVTLRVSDQVSFTPGERAVFYVKATTRGTFVPHLRGQGVLKLDAANKVAGSTLTLEQVRREVAAARTR